MLNYYQNSAKNSIPIPNLFNYQKSASDSLGNTCEITQPPLTFSRLQRWAFQSAARLLLPSERVASCCRVLREKNSGVDIHHSVKFDSYHYANLVTCGSVWTCPVCAAKITERRRQELVHVIDEAVLRGNSVLLLTLTVPHYFGQSCKEVTEKISYAKYLIQNRKTWKSLMRLFKLFGDIRSLEVTHGKNGWHPHFHCLLFFDKQKFSKFELINLQNQILACWQKACLSAGLPLPNSHGVTIQATSKGVADYVQKWGIDYEMTKGHTKQGREAGCSPFGLLADYLAGDLEAGRLFQEFAKVFKGKRQLVYSRGLRSMFGLNEKMLTDEELAEQQTEDAQLFASLSLNVWRIILRGNLRGELLEICRNGYDAFQDYICNLMIADKYYLTDS